MDQIAEIKQQATEWAKTFLSPDFEFRKYQLDAIAHVVQNTLNKTKTLAMNAPTGSGKSLTAIIAAGVLWECYGKKSYILVSDLSLFEQYERDLERYELPWGHLKGKDNYVCQRNGNIVSCGECSLNMVGTTVLADTDKASMMGYGCAKNCEYVKMRNLAIKAPVTIMTYQLYLIQRNYVAEMMTSLAEDAPFEARDLVICDEAHKLPDIIQNHFAPRVPAQEPEFMKTLNEWAKKNGKKVPNSKVVTTISANIMSTDDHDDLIEYMAKYSNLLSEYAVINEAIRKQAKETRQFKQMAKYLAAGNLCRECNCKFGDFFKLTAALGNQIAVKTDGEDESVINCTYEGAMIKRYFHDVSNSELLMSATLGDLKMYRVIIGMNQEPAEQYKTMDIPSTFDFSKSPIYYSDKNPMSFKEKAKSIGPICSQITEICRMFKGNRGIIQTGNYENSKKLLERIPADVKKRIILYGSAKDKMFAISKFEKSQDGILVGPTLLEGLNFDGDKCRFAICMKLPYASLANKLVAAKKDLIENWYNYDLMAKLEQGFGRGVRYNGDWCINYILDGCFVNILKYNPQMVHRGIKARLRKLE